MYANNGSGITEEHQLLPRFSVPCLTAKNPWFLEGRNNFDCLGTWKLRTLLNLVMRLNDALSCNISQTFCCLSMVAKVELEFVCSFSLNVLACPEKYIPSGPITKDDGPLITPPHSFLHLKGNGFTAFILSHNTIQAVKKLYIVKSWGGVLLFAPKTTNVPRKVVKVTHKPIRTISKILKKPKDKIEREASRGIVKKIKCKDCDCVYVGQASRTLKEHAKAIATLDENSLLAKHHMLHSHQIDLESVKIVDRSSMWQQRLILEAWNSVQDRTL